jgi:hypothetical protein
MEKGYSLVGGLRMMLVTFPIQLYSHVFSQSLPSYCSDPSYRYSYVDSEVNCNHNDVCWSKPDFERIMSTFHLPKRYLQVLSREHTIFAGLQVDDEDEDSTRFGE